MTKKKILSREDKLEIIRNSFKPVETATRVKAWVFAIEKQYYVVISYFVSRMGNYISVFPSNRKGIKADNKAIIEIKNSDDYMKGFEMALEILMPNIPEVEIEQEIDE